MHRIHGNSGQSKSPRLLVRQSEHDQPPGHADRTTRSSAWNTHSGDDSHGANLLFSWTLRELRRNLIHPSPSRATISSSHVLGHSITINRSARPRMGRSAPAITDDSHASTVDDVLYDAGRSSGRCRPAYRAWSTMLDSDLRAPGYEFLNFL